MINKVFEILKYSIIIFFSITFAISFPAAIIFSVDFNPVVAPNSFENGLMTLFYNFFGGVRSIFNIPPEGAPFGKILKVCSMISLFIVLLFISTSLWDLIMDRKKTTKQK